MEKSAPAKEDQAKSFVRRDKLIENEREAQALWEQMGINQSEPQPGKKKFMATFPFPYMNGRMHLGHAFSLTKAEFFIRFKRMRGFNVLFPMGFHCTGMPICASAKRLKEELDTQGIAKLKETIEANSKLPVDKRPPMSQYEILLKQEIGDEEIPRFVDPIYWVNYFPGKAYTDLRSFGLSVDWRRSFITTEENAYFDNFVKWHFLKLKAASFMKFGQRPSIYCIKDKQMCADHDRADGEGVEPKEYTLVKMKLLEFPGVLGTVKDRNVFLVAGTLRPETMYGQTNCFVLPEGEYGAYEAKNNEVWICSEHSVRNMAYQDLLKTHETIEKIADIKGQDLIGLPVKAPLASFEKIYVIPMLSIKMNMGTGIVTSVPSDSPDDYMTLKEFQKKPALREKYGLKDEAIMPFEPVSIIEIPGYSNMSAEKACTDLKITSMNDAAKLALAKEKTYTLGFYDGIMGVGPYKGQKVKDAKLLVRTDLINSGEAAIYYEPESEVISRSRDKCVVALIDQWYLPYGDEPYKSTVKDYINSSEFTTFNSNIKEAFNAAVDWFKAWGCSRSFGLGTKFPWDDKYLIESLSDSTIYMSYYTVAHFLQSDLEGRKRGSLDIAAEDIQEKDWDYVFLNQPYDTNSKIPEEKLKTMRDSFRYWYPLDLRVSGKDLIRNHLTMSLYNHSVVWNKEGNSMLPKAFFCNGWVLVDNKKMSKSLGNFYTIKDLCEKFGADASRISLANAGDTLNDANVSLKEIDEAILKLSALEMWIKDKLTAIDTFRSSAEKDSSSEYHDRIFENELNKVVVDSFKNYESMVLREVVKQVFFTLHDLREEYFINCAAAGMKRELVIRYISLQLALLYPIAPHFTEITWNKTFVPSIGKDKERFPEYLSHYTIPEVDPQVIDLKLADEYAFYNKVARNMRTTFDRLTTGKKKKMEPSAVKTVTIILNDKFEDWQVTMLEYFKTVGLKRSNAKDIKWKDKVNEIMDGQDKKKVTKAFEFGSLVMADQEEVGDSAYNVSLSYDQKEVLTKAKDVLLRDLKHIEKVNIITIEEAEKSENAQIKTLAQSCQPGSPQILFE